MKHISFFVSYLRNRLFISVYCFYMINASVFDSLLLSFVEFGWGLGFHLQSMNTFVLQFIT